MKRHMLRMTTGILGLAGILIAGGQVARAEFIYTTTVAAVAAPGAPAVFGPSATVALANGNSLVYLTSNSAGSISSDATLTAGGGADITFGNIGFNPGASSTPSLYSVNFNYRVVITDTTNSLSQVVNFTANQAGFVKGVPRTITNNFTNFAAAPTNFTLGNIDYTVFFKSATGPGSTGTSLGSVSGNVISRVRGVPEPGSIALLGMGLVGAFGIHRRRRASRA